VDVVCLRETGRGGGAGSKTSRTPQARKKGLKLSKRERTSRRADERKTVSHLYDQELKQEIIVERVDKR